MKKGLLLLAFLLAPSAARAAMFNDVVPGARPMGMGYAYTAVAEGPEAMYFNPAGLAGSDYTQVHGGVARMHSPVGMLTLETATYTRPLPILPGSTVGASFTNLRQNNGGDKDAFLLHFSHQIRVPQLYLKMPLKLGANVRFVNVSKDPSSPSKFGPGIDFGALFDSGSGLKAGASVTGLTTGLKVPDPSLNLGVGYRLYKRFLLAGDLRVRESLTQFFPGVEVDFFEQLLKVRAGKGLPLDGVGNYAFGFGANFSPLIIDVAMTVPWAGFRRSGGGCQLTATYKFGAPPFSGRYVGSAARRAEDLRTDIGDLEDRRKTLEGQVASAEADKTSVEGQVQAQQQRLKEVQERLRDSELRLERAQYELNHPQGAPSPVEGPGPRSEALPALPVPYPETAAPAPAPAPQARPKPARVPAKAAPSGFPRKHVVKAGETLRSISKEYYGDGGLWEQVFEANPDKVERGLPVENAVLTIPAPRTR
ncbi:MAG: hypothetical protein WC969_10290 [Elusimicrobiota bacterium]|jgi:hypothetical protein